MTGTKKEIILPDGSVRLAQAPVIVTASRATDIPAFYGDWLAGRLKAGYAKWHNPFNNQCSYISFSRMRLVVFWTKNPRPLMQHPELLDKLVPQYYFQFTLNDYQEEGLEPGLPSLEQRIETFMELSDHIGSERIIWRFDPLLLTNKQGVEEMLRKVERVGERLYPYTKKLVFSFADIVSYRRVSANLHRSGISCRECNPQEMEDFARGLQRLNEKWKLQLATCAEQIPLEKYGIHHNKCIDDALIARLYPQDKELLKYMGWEESEPTKLPLFYSSEEGFSTSRKLSAQLPETERLTSGSLALHSGKDKGQRRLCGCIPSKDIGAYSTCPHGCLYCYANRSPEAALQRWKKTGEHSDSEWLGG